MKRLFRFSPLIAILVLILLPVGLTPPRVDAAGATDHFVITVKTNNSGMSSSNQFIIPTVYSDIGSGYNYNVDCDNNGTNEMTGLAGSYTCTYFTAGTHTIRIKDNRGDGTGFPRIYFNFGGDRLKLLAIQQWGTGKWTSMANAFYGCANLTVTATDSPDLSGVADLSGMFRSAGAFNQNLNNWNTSHVTNMNNMFDGDSAFNGDIGSWSTVNVTTMSGMFHNAHAFNQNIGSWSTANVTDMHDMFNGASVFNQNIGSWSTANVTDMGGLFHGASAFNGNIGTWNTSNVTNMAEMFGSASAFNQNISNWNTANVTDMSFMFGGASAFNQSIGGWNTANVTNMRGLFSSASAFNGNIGTWNTSHVTNMFGMFGNASAFNQNIGTWNTANVTDMSFMFHNANIFNQNIGAWDTANVTNLSHLFDSASAFNQNIGNWNTAGVTDMTGMFYDASAFNQNIGSWNTGNVTSMYLMFQNAGAFNQDLGDWNVGALTDASMMFHGVALSPANYDALLNGWSAQTLHSGVVFDGGDSHYCSGQAARTILTIAPNNWTITDGGEYCPSPDDFVITVKTNNPGTSTSTQFNIPTTGGGYNYNVDCNNDGVNEVTGRTGSYTCDFGPLGLNTGAGTYTIRIKDNSGVKIGFPRIYFNYAGDAHKLLTIEQWGTGKWTSMAAAFAGCANLAGQASDSPDLSVVTDLSYMFYGASAFNGNIGSWSTSHVINMSWMFFGASAFNQNIGAWDTTLVSDMSYMFDDASAFNQNLGSWNTANVTDMSYMFYGASAFNQNLGSWNTVKVTNMRGLFGGIGTFNQNIGNWNTANVTDMHDMFNGASAFNQNLGSWDTSKVTDMNHMFLDAGAFNQDIANWNTANVTDMSLMFYDASAFNQNIGSWNTAKVTDMHDMFNGASAFDQNLGAWNVSALTQASEMFSGTFLSTSHYDALLNGWSAQTLKHNVRFSGGYSHYCSAKVARNLMTSAPNNWIITDGGESCPAINDFVITVKTNNPGTSTGTQFTIPTIGGGYNYSVDCNNDGTPDATAQSGDSTCTYGTAGTYTLRIKDNSGAGTGFPRIYFNNGGDAQKLLAIEQWGKGKWTSMANAFYGCSNLAGQASDAPDLSGVTDLSGMLRGAGAFNQNIGSWTTTGVTNMNSMFYGAGAFNQNIGNWNTTNVTNMGSMFNGASAFNQNIGSWDTANVTAMRGMFYGAAAFNQDIHTWNTAKVTNMSQMFQSATTFNQSLDSWQVGALTNAIDMFKDITLSTANYDALLNGWAAQTLHSGVSLSGGNSQYCSAAAARNTLTAAPNNWTITDGGSSCPTEITLAAFHVAQKSGVMRVNWETASELNVVSFNVWRQTKKGQWRMVNRDGIPAKHAGSLSGGKYTFTDKTAKRAKTYRYKLELVETNGSEWSEVIVVRMR